MAKLFKGKEVSDALTEKLIEEVKALKMKNIEPTLAIIRVGFKSQDLSYEESATKKCEAIGVSVKKYILDEDISQDSLLSIIDTINKDGFVHGVLMLRPLPKHLDDTIIRSALSPQKDVDGITDVSMAGVYASSDLGFPPCTPRACIEILDYYGVDVTGKDIVVLGRSLVVGKPVSMMLVQKNATVTICHTKTRNIEKIAARADILIVAAGIAKTIGPAYTNENQIIIDVGINFTEEGKLCGDVDFEKVEPLVRAITPVPGGVGTVTTGVLALQVIEAARKSAV